MKVRDRLKSADSSTKKMVQRWLGISQPCWESEHMSRKASDTQIKFEVEVIWFIF